jgi:tetratricopeptide (TPR) repeat protein
VNDESKKVLQDVSELCDDERELEAEVLLHKQLDNDPDNLELMTKLGEIQARLCNDGEAETTFRTVLIRDPDYEDAVCALAALLDQSLRSKEAERLYREFLQRNPASHQALEGLCRLLLSENRSGDALKLARKQVVEFEEELDAYKPIIYVLEILEDDLESSLLEDWNDQTALAAYLDNLLEQLEITLKLQKFEAPSEDFICEIQDEKSRLVCEIDQLVEQAASRSVSISSALQAQIASILKTVRNESQN